MGNLNRFRRARTVRPLWLAALTAAVAAAGATGIACADARPRVANKAAARMLFMDVLRLMCPTPSRSNQTGAPLRPQSMGRKKSSRQIR